MKVEVSHENSNHSNYEPCLDTSLHWYDEVVGFLDEMPRKLFRTVVGLRWDDENEEVVKLSEYSNNSYSLTRQMNSLFFCIRYLAKLRFISIPH